MLVPQMYIDIYTLCKREPHLFFEVVPKGPVAEHFKEGVMVNILHSSKCVMCEEQISTLRMLYCHMN
jgi:hypothetical protein